MKNKASDFSRPSKFMQRPFFIKILVFLMLIISIENFIRTGIAIQSWSTLQTYAAAPLPLYLVISGIMWGITFLLAAVLLWLRLTPAIYLSGGLFILFIIVFWLERAFLQVDPSRWHNAGFLILIQVLLLVFVFSSLWYVYPRKERVADEKE